MTAKPLKGIGIAITRPADQANKLASLITEAGGTPILFPLIEIVPLYDYSQFEAVISDIETYDWAIFISSNAVDQAMPRVIKRFGLVPKQLQFAAIGPQTAEHLGQFGVTRVLIPQARFDTESLLALAPM